MADKRLCQNCQAYIRADDALVDRCGLVPMELNAQFVRDEAPVYSYCTRQRDRTGSCGPEGRLYRETSAEEQLLQDWRKPAQREELAASLGIDWPTSKETPDAPA